MGERKFIKLDADGEGFLINEETKSIVLNGKEFILPNEVWHFMMCLESEREYYRKKYMKNIGKFNE